MRFLPSSENRISNSIFNVPTASEAQYLFDGVAGKVASWPAAVTPITIEFGLVGGVRPSNLFGIAGLSGPITSITAAGMVANVWQPAVPVTVRGGTGFAELPEASYTRVRFTMTRQSLAPVRIGEVLFGQSLSLPDPSSVQTARTVPTTINGDYASRVGGPFRSMDLGFPPSSTPAIEDFLFSHGGEGGLLVVNGEGVFGRLGIETSHSRTIDHDLYEGASLSMVEFGGAIWP